MNFAPPVPAVLNDRSSPVEPADWRSAVCFPDLRLWCPDGVSALASTRYPGHSRGPWSGLNLGLHVGDDPADVLRNRQLFAQALSGARPIWLEQVHGVHVVRAGDVVADGLSQRVPVADACWTDQPGLACVVMVADCLPVLFTHRQGTCVAAAHAGWRGLAAGVLLRTVQTLCQAVACEPSDLKAWIGPSIGPDHFEVGRDVVDAFAGGASFRPKDPGSDGQARWWADLPSLAVSQLHGLGLSQVSVNGRCTYRDGGNFFSHRRDRRTGRQAVAIWLR